MIYASVCSGIEAPSVAWAPLGWEPAWFSEIEPFPCAVLAHRYPTVPNHGDMTKLVEDGHAEPGSIDLLVGGTPCQSFSVAGLRKGLADPRGNLALVFLAIVDRARPRWVVWENVPGVLSVDRGRAFGAFLGGLGQLGYGFAYRVLDAQYFGLAQRRKRVFVVGYLGDWRRAAAVLFERASLSGNPPPRREAGQRAADTSSDGARGGGELGEEAVARTLLGGARRLNGAEETFVVHSLKADGFDGSEDGTGRGTPIVPVMANGAVGANGAGIGSGGDPAFTLDTTGLQAVGPVTFDWQAGGGGNDQSFRGKSRSYVVDKPGTTRALTAAKTLAVAFDARQSDVITYGEKAGPLDTDGHSQAVAFQTRGSNLTHGEVSGTLGVNGGSASGAAPMVTTLAIRGRGDSHDLETREDGTANAILTPNGGRAGIGVGAVAIHENSRKELRETDIAGSVSAGGGKPGQGFQATRVGTQVRRLTPRECERLQGFPDDYTLIQYRGKPAADGPRYKALGNSMATTVVRWIGRRIAMVEALTQEIA